MLKIAGIEHESIVDGPGLRTVLFFQGCLRHCEGCHNPETWDMEGGTEVTVDAVLAKIESNPLCSGITYSGGEPFLQADELIHLTHRLKEKNYEIAAYTGFLFEELLNGTKEQQELLNMIDVLIDGSFILSERSLDMNFIGSGNQRIIDVQKSRMAGHVILETSERWNGG